MEHRVYGTGDRLGGLAGGGGGGVEGLPGKIVSRGQKKNVRCVIFFVVKASKCFFGKNVVAAVLICTLSRSVP